MDRRGGVCVLAMLSLLAGCTAESPPSQRVEGTVEDRPRAVAGAGRAAALTENRPAVVRTARLQPEPVTLTQPVSVVVEAEDPEGGAVTFKHQWYLNGKPLPDETAPTLPPAVLSRGDRVSVEITPMDAKGAGIPHRTTEVLVANTPPTVSRILLKPFPVRVGDRLVAEAESEDPDGDDVTYEFRWYRNGEEVLRADHDALDTSDFVRGDQLVVEVTPHDGIDGGAMLRSDPVTIDNSPPEITSLPPTQIQGGLYAYAVTATDRDGDPLTYALEAAPPGMTIDPQTGRLQWRVTEEAIGTHRVQVAVNDGQVAEPTVQEFELRLDADTEG